MSEHFEHALKKAREHPALKTVCQEMPEIMNHILTQSFENITALNNKFPLLHFLPRSENDDPPDHTWELKKTKQCYKEAFPTTRYFFMENFATIRAAIFNMIIFKVYRKLDLPETYPASDNEKSELDSTRICSTASNSMVFSRSPNLKMLCVEEVLGNGKYEFLGGDTKGVEVWKCGRRRSSLRRI